MICIIICSNDREKRVLLADNAALTIGGLRTSTGSKWEKLVITTEGRGGTSSLLKLLLPAPVAQEDVGIHWYVQDGRC